MRPGKKLLLSILVLIVPLVLSTLACNVPRSLYEFSRGDVLEEGDFLTMAEDEEEYGFEVDSDPTEEAPKPSGSGGEDAGAAAGAATSQEQVNAGTHHYIIAGSCNNSFVGDNGNISDSGSYTSTFRGDGVALDYPVDSFYRRVGENTYEELTAEGVLNTLEYTHSGFNFSSVSPTGFTMDLTFTLDD
ncbi:MAG: hypothetical protein JXA97_08215 [Anaerolineales bacterium]|nr:hypothetical protein [Anaerolineales bacterium]